MTALRALSTKCPECESVLHWETLAGNRIFRTVDGRQFYPAYCTLCRKHYEVKRTKKIAAAWK